MKILVDTSIWSIVLRRRKKTENERILSIFKDLIKDFLVKIIGPIRQEILSGISDYKIYTTLKEHLYAFEDIPISTQDYIRAAEFYNLCRKNGIQGSHIDFLICSISVSNNLKIFTTDKDFQYYSQYLPIHFISVPRFL